MIIFYIYILYEFELIVKNNCIPLLSFTALPELTTLRNISRECVLCAFQLIIHIFSHQLKV